MNIDKNLKEQIDYRIKVFWEQNDKFRNHPLKTEQPNSDTFNLSELAKNDLQGAVDLLKDVDCKAIKKMLDYLPELEDLKKDIQKTLKNNNKIFISGCGSSGRLAVALEYLWNYSADVDAKGQVIGFLGGGDNAMIKAIEGFEDFKDYGVKQLQLAGFQDGDLLIAASASGESPFVLATAEYAAKTSVKPWFIHCNTNDSLLGRIKDHVIFNENVKVMGLYTGEMALTGSTRMQATTNLLLGIGLPLFGYDIEEQVKIFSKFIENLDYSMLPKLIKDETLTYQNGEYVFYAIDKYYGITVLTDTTERTPTFNLIPFENQYDSDKKTSWCYILLKEAKNAEEAWTMLLGRKPRTLDWAEETSFKRLLGFNFGRELVDIRGEYAKPSHFYEIKKNNDEIIIGFKENTVKINVEGLEPLFEQIVLKLVLNTASTIMMGRMGYYEGNLMTSLYPSNSKLIDRSIRYIDFILKNKYKIDKKYDDIAEAMFKELYILKTGESIVLKTVEKIKHEDRNYNDYLLRQASKLTGEDGKAIANRMFESHSGLVNWALDNVSKRLPAGEISRILDIGCGSGTGIRLLKKNFPKAEFTGIDYSKDMVELTIENNLELVRQEKLQAYCASVESLPFEENYFDLVIGIETFYFWENKIKSLKEIKRILKKNAQFLMINEAFMFDDLYKVSPQMEKFAKNSNLEINTVEEYQDYFKTAGFIDVEYKNRKDKAWIYMIGRA